MTLHLHLSNKKFEDSLSVSLNGETKELTAGENHISFEVPDTAEITVQIRHVKNSLQKIRNPIGRFVVWLLFCLISPLIFFADSDSGIGKHQFFSGANPFDLQKTFRVPASAGGTVPTAVRMTVTYEPPKYDKLQKTYTAPDIRLTGAEVADETRLCTYNPADFKTEFRLYHYPAYILLFAILLALHLMMLVFLVNQITPFNPLGVVGIAFCWLIVMGLSVGIVWLFAATHKLLRQVDGILRAEP
jgi:hypothetical protein